MPWKHLSINRLARIIHDFGDKKSLLWYKHVEMTMF